jgi:UDP-2-acetamido-2-deoxy-ribo-hexuluronate aminotransferase
MKGKVIFCDINEEDFNIDPKEIEKKITKKTKCILPVDLYGQIYDYTSIKTIAEKHNLHIVEDACQSI